MIEYSFKCISEIEYSLEYMLMIEYSFKRWNID